MSEEVSEANVSADKGDETAISSDQQTTTSSNEKPSFLRKVSECFQQQMHSSFYRLGFLIAGNPWKTIALVFVVTGLCSIGIISYELETRDTELFTPKRTLAFEHLDFVQENFPGTGYMRVQRMIVTSKEDGGDIATKKGLLSLVNILKVSENTTVQLGDSDITHSDVCFKTYDKTGVSHCHVSSVLDLFYEQSFITGSPPNFLDTVKAKIDTISDSEVKATLSLPMYTSWNNGPLVKDKAIGKASGSGDDFKAEAFFIDLLLDSTPRKNADGKIENSRVIAWEREWIKNFVGVTIEGAEDTEIYINAFISEDDESAKIEGKDFSKIFIGYSMVSAYVLLMLGHLNSKCARVSLGGLGLMAVGLSYIATMGISSAIGFKCTTVHDALLLLLFAIGIDDAFVIMAAYDHTDTSLPIQERIAWTLSDAGFAISITSFTNASAFFIGSMTGLPALKSFCVWAGIGILFVYLFQSTFFIACATLDARRRANDRMECFICLPAKTDGELNIFGQKHGVVERFFENKYAPFVFNNKVRYPILIFTLGMFSTCVFGMSQLRQNFDIAFFYSGYVKTFDDIDKEYSSKTIGLTIEVYTGEFDYKSIENQKHMARLFDPNGDLATNKWVIDGSLQSWYSDFRDFASLNDIDSTLEPNTFYTELQKFLISPAGAKYVADINLDTSTGEISSTRSSLVSVYLATNDIQVDAMKGLRETINSIGVPKAFPFTFWFIFYEQFAVLVKETLQIVFSALAVVFLVTFLLIANPVVSIIVLMGVGLSLVDILGVMYFWEIDLNTVSVIVLSMAVGLTIDSAAHMGLGFMESVGTRRERIISSLKHLGPPLLHGSVSTFLAISVLMFSVAYIFKVFFKMFLLIILFGAFHGIVVVPLLLDLIGPVGYYRSKEEKEKAERALTGQIGQIPTKT